MRAARFIVKGLVQGVGYRYFAVRAASRLGVTGQVTNLPDGTVEVIAEGSAALLASLRNELERGPAAAQVTAVEESDMPVTGRYKQFDVGY